MGCLESAALAGLGEEEALHNRAAVGKVSAGPDYWERRGMKEKEWG